MGERFEHDARPLCRSVVCALHVAYARAHACSHRGSNVEAIDSDDHESAHGFGLHVHTVCFSYERANKSSDARTNKCSH